MPLPDPSIVWVVNDPFGRPVSFLAERKYHIITGHPELVDYVDQLATIIPLPHMILEDQFDTSTEVFCKLGVGLGCYSGKWLKVPVRYDITDSGEVLTAYFAEKVPKGKIKWMPRKLK